jgi:hypothetical protein
MAADVRHGICGLGHLNARTHPAFNGSTAPSIRLALSLGGLMASGISMAAKSLAVLLPPIIVYLVFA